MKFYSLFLGMTLIACIQTEIREITYLNEMFTEIRSDSIVLMDLDETLIESSIMLGGKAWRNYAVNLLKPIYSQQKTQELRDKITYWIAQRVPCMAVENSTRVYLDQLKEKHIPIFGFTSRGKKHWNTMPCPNGEEMAVLHLKQAGFDLDVSLQNSHTNILSSHQSFARGIFFTSYGEKGKLAMEIFSQARFSHVVFVDDMLSNITSMELAFAELGIPAICFYYPHVDLYRSFDPLIAAIQLEKLYRDNRILSDTEAALFRQDYVHLDPDLFLLELMEQIERDVYGDSSNPYFEEVDVT